MKILKTILSSIEKVVVLTTSTDVNDNNEVEEDFHDC
jgi:hypothetical protein